MANILEDQVAIVTGAGQGIGEATALCLGREGASVVVVDINPTTGQTTAEAITAAGGQATFVQADISDADSVKSMVEQAIAAYAKIDAMVNVAGIQGMVADVVDLPHEEWNRVLSVNITSIFLCAKYCIPHMRKQGSGAIVNVTSPSFPSGVERLAPYAVSKGAIYSLTRTLALEPEPFGITVNALAPRRLRTRATQEQISSLRAQNAPAERIAALEELFQEPEDVAPLAVFFATPESRAVTGRILFVEKDRIAFIAPPAMEPSAYHPAGHWNVDDLAKVVPRMARS